MHPPSAVCRALARLPRAKLRLAWHGPRKQFAIVQLYHIKDLGAEWSWKTFRMEWDVDDGPVFGKSGGSRDWDPLFYRPVFVGMIEDFDCDTRGVMSGRIVDEVRQALCWSGDHGNEKTRNRMRKDYVGRIKDLSGEMAEYMHSVAGNSDETSVDVPWDFARDDVERMYRQKEQRERDLYDYYRVPGMRS